MKDNQNVKGIEEKLPRGAKKVISENTGLSYNTVCSFFKNKKTSIQTDRKIKMELKKIITEYETAI